MSASSRIIEQARTDFAARGKELLAIALTGARKGRSPLFELADIRGLAAEELANYAAQLEARCLELQLETGTDHLTRVRSRASIERFLEKELTRTSRTLEPTAVVMIDLDHFKGVNDELGHEAGDEALRRVGEALLGMVRATDSVGRLGGEEFLVVLSGANELKARRFAERARREIAELLISDGDGDAFRVTASVGVAVTRMDVDRSRLVKAADAAMYRAKGAGRNRVRLAEPRG